MIFAHEHEQFDDLLRIVVSERGLSEALIEKDYWVTHTLWALTQTGLDVWFKGGTSLSKGFGLITRFSEDLDLKIERGTLHMLPAVTSWTSKNKGPTATRRAFYEALATRLGILGVPVKLVEGSLGKDARGAKYEVLYPGSFLKALPPPMRPFVLLEVGDARVIPCVERPLTSWVHEALEKRGDLSAFTDNRPAAVRCVHPLVTLLDKLDAISIRFAKGDPASTFVRHYEDTARIIHAANEGKLPALDRTPRSLADEMVAARDLRSMPVATDPAFTLIPGDRRKEIERAYEAIAPMFWGTRVLLVDALEVSRDWCARALALEAY